MIKEFLQFEEESQVLEYKFNYRQLLIWPYIRTLLLEDILKQEHGIVYVRDFDRDNRKYQNYIRYNTFKAKKCDILIWTDATDYVVEDGNTIKARCMDDYFKDTDYNCLRMINCDKKINFNKITYPFMTDTFINKMIELDADFLTESEEESNIDELILYLKKNLPLHVEEGMYCFLKKFAKIVIKKFPLYYKYFNVLLNKISPKAFFCIAGCYSKPLIKVLNDYGIITVEIQHGTISKMNSAYAYSKKIAESQLYREYMPKYFLSYGEYWTKDIYLPMEVKNIGNACFSINSLNAYKFVEEKGCILIIMSTKHDDYKNFITYVVTNMPNEYRIIAKTHPSMPKDARYYLEFESIERVSIVTEGNIYEYIAKAEYVIGDGSTAMYEAAGMGKKIAVFNNEIARSYLDKNIGVWISNGEEFYNCIKENKIHGGIYRNDYFEPGWKENFHLFLEGIMH